EKEKERPGRGERGSRPGGRELDSGGARRASRRRRRHLPQGGDVGAGRTSCPGSERLESPDRPLWLQEKTRARGGTAYALALGARFWGCNSLRAHQHSAPVVQRQTPRS